MIERKGPVCGLITTAGFRDVLELGRQHNPVLYDIFSEEFHRSFPAAAWSKSRSASRPTGMW